MHKNILVADGSTIMRDRLRSLLEKNKYVVVAEAKDGYEAVQKYIEFSPDIVLLDISMPRLNGIEALRLIKQFDKSAKVIMCSSTGQESMVRSALYLGAKNFIVKPYFDLLVATIENVE